MKAYALCIAQIQAYGAQDTTPVLYQPYFCYTVQLVQTLLVVQFLVDSGCPSLWSLRQRLAAQLAVQVMSYGASAESAAMTTIFTRMLQHSLKDSQGLSQHPAATGEDSTATALAAAIS